MTNNEWIERAIEWAKRKGINAIKAVHQDYEDPTSFTQKSTGDTFTPNLTGMKRTRKNYVEIALKDTDNRSRKISKWKLLSALATQQGGRFYLLAPRGHKAFAEKIIEKYNLNSMLVAI